MLGETSIDEPPRNLLGAILAGGQGIRFGKDKVLAQMNGVPLIELTKEALSGQVDEIVICGRTDTRCKSIEDAPEAGLGPLGGLCAALRYAKTNGFTHVLSVPADSHPIPLNLADIFCGKKLQVFSNQWLIGLWPVRLSMALEAYLRSGRRSVRGWLEIVNPERIDDAAFGLININEPQDLIELRSRMGSEL